VRILSYSLSSPHLRWRTDGAMRGRGGERTGGDELNRWRSGAGPPARGGGGPTMGMSSTDGGGPVMGMSSTGGRARPGWRGGEVPVPEQRWRGRRHRRWEELLQRQGRGHRRRGGEALTTMSRSPHLPPAPPPPSPPMLSPPSPPRRCARVPSAAAPRKKRAGSTSAHATRQRR
jgi:hypothetical protein